MNGGNKLLDKKNTYVFRIIRLLLGLVLYGAGSFLTIQANIGLAPWEAFSVGISDTLGMRYGDVVVLTGFIILAADIALKEKVGLGTILNIFIIGKVVDLLFYLDFFPKLNNFLLGVGVLLIGQFVICVGSVLYIGSALGCGPRDALMMALSKRLPKVPIGAIRGIIEGAVLLIGWLLGAKVGLGTVISVFGIGLILQYTFKLLCFQAKDVAHEDVISTIKAFRTGNSRK